MNKFKELGLSEDILKIIEQEKYEEPSEVQEKVIPVALTGKDIIAGSATGSGKTLVFASTIIQKLKKDGNIQALVLVPTRELAEQVSDYFKKFSKIKHIKTAPVYGGVGKFGQIRDMRDCDVVVGTPGRILDHITSGTLDLGKIKFLVLDEVDRMFDMGFRRDVEKIIRYCPKERQTLLFSATLSEDIHYLIERNTNNPVTISVNNEVDPTKLKQIYYQVQHNQKLSLLVYLLNKEQSDLVMVFANTRDVANFLEKNLKFNGIDALAIHGGLSQNRRSHVLDQFHGKGVKVLVCTDIAARGLDIKGVTHVYNFNIPANSKDYVHRIGRTARAGNDGIAINLVSPQDYDNFGEVLRRCYVEIPQEKLPEFPQLQIKQTPQDSRGNNPHQRRFGGGRSFNNNRGPRNYRDNNRGRDHNNTNANDSSNESKEHNPDGNQNKYGNYKPRSNFKGRYPRSNENFGVKSSKPSRDHEESNDDFNRQRHNLGL